MNRVEALFYLFDKSSNKIREKESGRVWRGVHRSPVTSNSVVTNSEIAQLPDVEFEKFEEPST